MRRRRLIATLLTAALAAVLASGALATTPRDEIAPVEAAPVDVATDEASDSSRPAPPPTGCSSGARTLSRFGDRIYPDQGNGGYTSVHSDVFLVYDTPTNMFLPGTHVLLTDRATQCLTDFSLDFERTNANAAGPNMTVGSITVNGVPATFRFVQPTYPGDPNGQDDPDPAAHAVSNSVPVSATNPNPPACSPQGSGNGQNGTQCAANKLVITPSAPIAAGDTFVVRVDYTGRPGVHVDGDGSTEGWFRVNTTAAPNDGSFVTTEPIGTASWMPLNNHPSAKPTYDFYDTVNAGKTAIANGELVGAALGPTFGPVQPTTVNPPDMSFPAGSWTWHWHSPEPVANYLVENSIGGYDLTARIGANGVQYYQAQGSSIVASRKALNKIAMDSQEDMTAFQTLFNGPYPFTTAGVVVGIPSASFEEEMQTKITFAGGTIGGAQGTTLGTLNHENMHQWFGDNVSEAAFNLTFWKEGFATIGEYLATARTAATAAGGLGTPAGDTAFENSLIARFNTNYGSTGTFWTVAPSNASVTNLFTTANTYTRPGTAYLALWRILGRDRMVATMKQIQSDYGGGTITESQLEDEFHAALPNQSEGCHARLDEFFTQWFDTAYPNGGGVNRPQITGPGLAGPGFVCAPSVTYTLTPSAPTGNGGWYTGAVAVAWRVDDGGDPLTATDGCVDRSFTTDGALTASCSATNTIGSASAVVNVKRDATPPVTSASLAATPVGEWFSARTVTLTATDATSGVATTLYRVDGGPWTRYASPFVVTSFGPHTLEFSTTDKAGNVEAVKSVSWGSGPSASAQLAGLSGFVSSLGAADLQKPLADAAAKVSKNKDACADLDKFLKLVIDGAGSSLTFAQADQLLAANQIETLVGCNPRSAAEHDALGLAATIAGSNLDAAIATDLANRARKTGEQIVARKDADACSSVSDLSRKVADLQARGKLSPAQTVALDTATAATARDLSC